MNRPSMATGAQVNGAPSNGAHPGSTHANGAHAKRPNGAHANGAHGTGALVNGTLANGAHAYTAPTASASAVATPPVAAPILAAAPAAPPARNPLFAKAVADTRARDLIARGVYAYFRAIEETTPSEARIDGRWKIMLGSNNYLGLTHHPRVLEAGAEAARRYGSGATGSRLLNGTLDLHETLEARLAAFYRKEAALVFTTGYQASLGAVAALIGRDDIAYLDKLDHACIVDGARLAMGQTVRYAHNDLRHLDRQLERAPEGAGKLVVTDGVFSMDGVIADVPGLVALCRARGAALLVDDAHALGVLGEDGAGTARYFGLDNEVDMMMATFSKSLASIGGVLVGSEEVIHFVRHNARAFMFTAAMPPASVAGTLAALDVMLDEPERRTRLFANTHRMAEGLTSVGLAPIAKQTPILPVVVGTFDVTLKVWRTLFEEDHIFVQPVPPPAVPPNGCRLRLSMTAEHTDDQIDRVIEALARAVRRHAPEALERNAAA